MSPNRKIAKHGSSHFKNHSVKKCKGSTGVQHQSLVVYIKLELRQLVNQSIEQEPIWNSFPHLTFD